jgi:hypothetical protein
MRRGRRCRKSGLVRLRNGDESVTVIGRILEALTIVIAGLLVLACCATANQRRHLHFRPCRSPEFSSDRRWRSCRALV